MTIVAISDQHGHFPSVPPCDLLIVAGDQCPDVFGGMAARAFPDRQWKWFVDTWLPWRYRQPATGCLVTWGNHDYCGTEHLNSDRTRDGKWTSIVCDRQVERLGLKMYLTPWSNQFMTWAFMREPRDLVRVYDAIPPGIDILVSHQPPHGCGDEVRYTPIGDGAPTHHFGSLELRDAIRRVQPRVVVCGHIHYGHGKYDLDGIPVYNVSVVDEQYKLVHPPTVVYQDNWRPIAP